jgi:hypothetical protein
MRPCSGRQYRPAAEFGVGRFLHPFARIGHRIAWIDLERRAARKFTGPRRTATGRFSGENVE